MAERGWGFVEPIADERFELVPESKTVVLVGSVGRPKQGDPRANYVLVNGTEITFRRIDYDYELTRTKIKGLPDIDDSHGDRLHRGIYVYT